MAIGLNAIAQQPVFYGFRGIDNELRFIKYDYKFNSYEIIDCNNCEYPQGDIYGNNNTDFDPFNGRYFYPVVDKDKNEYYILELDVNSVRLRRHKLDGVNGRVTQIFYNPKNNSLIIMAYKNGWATFEFFLENGILKLIDRKYIVFRENKIAFNWETQEMAYANNPWPGNIGQVLIKNIHSGDTTKSYNFPVKNEWVHITWDVKNYNILLDTESDSSFFYSVSNKVEIIEHPHIATFYTYTNPFIVYNNELIYREKASHKTFILNVQEKTVDTLYNTSYFPLFPQLHTFEQPYIYVSENASYTSTYGKSYIWLWNDEPVENSNTQNFKPSKCGNYKVVVTHLDGRIDTSEAVNYTAKDFKGNEITGNESFAYPNPFKNALNIRYKTCTNNAVTIKIYNSLGAEVLVANLGNVEAGEHIYNWNSDANGVRYGLYFVRVYSGNELLSTQKVFKR